MTPSELPPPAGLIFDLDGTLVDTVGARIEGWIETLAEAGVATTRGQIGPLIGMDGKELARLVAGASARTLSEEEAEVIDRAAGEAFNRHNRSPRPLPGARQLLSDLVALGLPWVIATSSRAEQVEASVASLGLQKRPTIVDGSNVRHAKPEPDLLLLAAERLGFPPARCWAVGDSTWDMRAANAAGSIAVGVTAGAAVGAEALEEAGAALVVATLEELAPVLRGSHRAGG
jgi:HAD superfamily hydrolase (TIGR01509 family)